MGRSKGKKPKQPVKSTISDDLRSFQEAARIGNQTHSEQGGFSYAEEFAKAINGSRTPDTEDLDGDGEWATSEDYWNAGDWKKWNEAEEREMEMLQGPPAVTAKDWNQHLRYLDEPTYAAVLLKNEEVARTHAEIGRQMLHESKKLYEFGDKWRALSVEQRCRYVIGGLQHATLITGGWQACVRVSTPDLTLSSLAENPDGFIKLLRHMIQSHLNHPDQDAYDEWIDPTGTFDRFYAIQRTAKGEVPLHRAIRNMQAAVNGDRQTYICRFVFGVLYKMNLVEPKQYRIPSIDLPRLPLTRNLVRGVNPSGARVDDRNLDMLDVEGKRTQKDIDYEIEVTRRLEAGQVPMCAACYRARDEVKELVETDQQMQHCSRCLKVDRRIPYCSASCQSLDWPRHKREVHCGKILSKILSPPLFSPRSSTPLPTLAYQYQLHSLPRRAHPDYTLRFTLAGGTDVQKINISHNDILRQMESAQRVRTFGSVVFIAESLLHSRMSETWGVRIRRALIRQLSEELGVDAQELANECGVVLEEEEEKGEKGKSGKGEAKETKETKGKETKDIETNEEESLKSTSASAPLDAAAEARRKKNKKKREAKKRQKAAAKLDDDYWSDDLEEDSDDPDRFECNCGIDHGDGPGGMREYTKWLPKNKDATLEDLIQGMSDYTKFAFANPLK